MSGSCGPGAIDPLKAPPAVGLKGPTGSICGLLAQSGTRPQIPRLTPLTLRLCEEEDTMCRGGAPGRGRKTGS